MSFFRAFANATQSIPGSTETELVFGAEDSDPDGVFASNRFTVPVGWNGKIGCLSAGYTSQSSTSTNTLRIQVSTDGGTSWTTIARQSNQNRPSVTVTAVPIVFVTGHIYRVVAFQNANTKENTPRNFFSGWYYPAATKVGMVRAELIGDLGGAANGDRIPTLDLEIVDSHGFHVLSSGIIIVPADFDGGFLHLTAAIRLLADPPTLRLWRSTDGGTTWTTIAEGAASTVSGTQSNECSCDGGAIAAVTGHQFRMTCRVGGSNFTFDGGTHLTNFSAIFFKY